MAANKKWRTFKIYFKHVYCSSYKKGNNHRRMHLLRKANKIKSKNQLHQLMLYKSPWKGNNFFQKLCLHDYCILVYRNSSLYILLVVKDVSARAELFIYDDRMIISKLVVHISTISVTLWLAKTCINFMGKIVCHINWT